ncbi:MAG: leucyl/phenylalanyl-tRNA--protein transferase, partial [Caulobacteraceae bacterium]|nr:leucyl/phenylalanyl-tRNA--protein transferase [Caulobacteraceae bacterium]
LARTLRSGRFSVTFDHAFESVVAACADRPQTWINQPIRNLYRGLFERGQAHSVEVWREGELAGGLYGVSLGGAFFGESMFSHQRDASKAALAALVDRLRIGGYVLLDAQFMTDHLRSLGAEEIPQAEYRRRLEAALATDGRWG